MQNECFKGNTERNVTGTCGEEQHPPELGNFPPFPSSAEGSQINRGLSHFLQIKPQHLPPIHAHKYLFSFSNTLPE